MSARKKIAPDWRGDVKEIKRDITRLHNGVTQLFSFVTELDSRLRALTESSGIRLLTPPDTNAVDGGEDQQDQPAVPVGGLGENAEPRQDVVS